MVPPVTFRVEGLRQSFVPRSRWSMRYLEAPLTACQTTVRLALLGVTETSIAGKRGVPVAVPSVMSWLAELNARTRTS